MLCKLLWAQPSCRSLDTWTVVYMTVAEFKPFMFSVWGFALSNITYIFIFIFMIVNEKWNETSYCSVSCLGSSGIRHYMCTCIVISRYTSSYAVCLQIVQRVIHQVMATHIYVKVFVYLDCRKPRHIKQGTLYPAQIRTRNILNMKSMC
jgi:hypothetical protein